MTTADIDSLAKRLSTYLSPDHVNDIRRAYAYSKIAHEGQFRRNGDPYITHPLAVAHILCNMHMDHQSIMAAMLHDVIEDTGVTKAELAEQFGAEVAELVDGVTKLTQAKFNSKAEAQAENFRKMMLAMTQDTRVILVKLADRLHNMRTLDVLSVEKRKRIAAETLDIYAPIANRLGMNEFRVEFEDLGFYALYPMRAPLIKKAVMAARGNRKELLTTITEALENRLQQEGLQARVIGREKHLYSIYEKMREKRKSFTDIMDVLGFRIITDNVDACYRALGIVHNLYKPVPGKFKDYIAIPKVNGYQSLHTVLKGHSGYPIEIQIRTEAMELMANNGIAAHWLYKSENTGFTNTTQTRAREWMKSLLELQKNAGTSLEFIESVKSDLFPNDVYVFTPQGKILTLPVGATAIDFAYAVHTDIGNTCVGVKIDNRVGVLSAPLSSGQTVEVITTKDARPNPAWLSFAVTSKARTGILHYLKNQTNMESIELGKRLLQKALKIYDTQWEAIDDAAFQSVVESSGLKSKEHLFEEIGLGNQLAQIVAARLCPDQESAQIEDVKTRGIAIRGTEGVLLTYARCCRPLPGDTIVGHLSAGKGIVVHRDVCGNMTNDMRETPERCMPLRWAQHVDREFQSELRIELQNQRGMLAEIARQATELEANIEGITLQEKGSLHGLIHMSLLVRDRVHLARVIKRMRIIPGVEKITRVRA